MGATGNLLEKYGRRCWNVAEQGALYFEKKVVEGLYLHKNVLTSRFHFNFRGDKFMLPLNLCRADFHKRTECPSFYNATLDILKHFLL